MKRMIPLRDAAIVPEAAIRKLAPNITFHVPNFCVGFFSLFRTWVFSLE